MPRTNRRLGLSIFEFIASGPDRRVSDTCLGSLAMITLITRDVIYSSSHVFHDHLRILSHREHYVCQREDGGNRTRRIEWSSGRSNCVSRWGVPCRCGSERDDQPATPRLLLY